MRCPRLASARSRHTTPGPVLWRRSVRETEHRAWAVEAVVLASAVGPLGVGATVGATVLVGEGAAVVLGASVGGVVVGGVVVGGVVVDMVGAAVLVGDVVSASVVVAGTLVVGPPDPPSPADAIADTPGTSDAATSNALTAARARSRSGEWGAPPWPSMGGDSSGSATARWWSIPARAGRSTASSGSRRPDGRWWAARGRTRRAGDRRSR